jgi:oxygen-independent coproporphyrinogen-3 oxidase
LDQYIQAGINRISLGVQSANETELMQMGRIHTFTDEVENIALARKAGFTNISVDLIFGLPGQSLQTWMNSLEQVTALGIEHLSLYSLTIEEGTTFGRWVGRGMMSATDDDFMADQFTAAKEWLAVNGFSHYEISNWRKNDRERDFTSRHNCQYWLNEPYIGLGLGSHSCFRNQRIANASTLAAYIRANLQQSTGKHALFPACVAVDEIDKITEMNETMMLGLRLLEDGVSKTRFYQRYGEQMEVLFASEIDELIQQGLLQWLDDERLTLTKRGILLGNQAFIKFV